jgi:hypothetical protein
MAEANISKHKTKAIFGIVNTAASNRYQAN